MGDRPDRVSEVTYYRWRQELRELSAQSRVVLWLCPGSHQDGCKFHMQVCIVCSAYRSSFMPNDILQSDLQRGRITARLILSNSRRAWARPPIPRPPDIIAIAIT